MLPLYWIEVYSFAVAVVSVTGVVAGAGAMVILPVTEPTGDSSGVAALLPFAVAGALAGVAADAGAAAGVTGAGVLLEIGITTVAAGATTTGAATGAGAAAMTGAGTGVTGIMAILRSRPSKKPL